MTETIEITTEPATIVEVTVDPPATVEIIQPGAGPPGPPGPAGPSGDTTIRHTTLTTPGTFDITGIPNTYTDLIIVLIARSTISAIGDVPRWRFNNDTGNNYYMGHYQFHGAGGASVDEAIAVNALNIGGVTGATSTANVYGTNELAVYGYANATIAKNIHARALTPALLASSNLFIDTNAGVWNNTTPIDRVTVTASGGGNFAAGSQLTIYGRG